MLTSARRKRTTRRVATATLALGLAFGSTAALGGAADAATKAAIYAPNGMVGVAENIAVQISGIPGQTITLGLTSGPIATTIQAVVNAQGWATASWTPTSAGAWTIAALGSAAAAGSTTITVAPMPTYTVLLAQQSVQSGVTNNLSSGVVAPIGTLAPTGSVYLSNVTGNGITTQPLSGNIGAGTSTAILPWNPSGAGASPVQASFQPNNGNFTASTSPVSQPFVTTARTTVALRWPATLYAGTTTVISAILGQGMPDGSVAFSMDGTGISGSIPTINGVANYQWTPPVSGIHTISVSYTGNPQPGQAGQQSGTNSQIVNIQGPRVADNITVDPPSQPAWSIASPITMTAGSLVTLAATAASNTTVLFSEQGPCAINGSVLTALSPGQCQVTAFTAGNASLTPGSETYTITIT
ncbi:MAG: hypothetical protein Q7K25_05450, partial [Actinomycetota bacterium]|nr:hypothetical protein [Actinomycetota bacterium]